MSCAYTFLLRKSLVSEGTHTHTLKQEWAIVSHSELLFTSSFSESRKIPCPLPPCLYLTRAILRG